MKIDDARSTTPTSSIGPVKRTAQRGPGDPPPDEPDGATVALSEGAAFVRQLAAEAEPFGEPRTELVEQTRAQLEDGSFGKDIDRDVMLSSLLADL